MWILPLISPMTGCHREAAKPPPLNDQALLDAYSNAVIGVTERVGPAVVRVETGPKVRPWRASAAGWLRHCHFAGGLVLTNSHVVGSSKEIRLRDTEGFLIPTPCAGVDPTPISPWRADGARDLPYARWAIQNLRRGQLVVAIGTHSA